MSAVSRLRKLRSMSGVELRARLAAAAYCAYERHVLRVPPDGRTPRSPHQTPHATAVTAASCCARFLPSVDDLAATRHVLQTRFSHETSASISRADGMRRGEFVLFGQTRHLGDTVNWQADPISERPWPLVYHRDVPIGDRSRAPGDAKDVWELNRQQFLADLAKAWLVTGREEYISRAHRLILTWIESNPYGLGVNWSGPLEVAYRSLSWLWVYCLASERLLTEADHASWLGGFQDHGRFLLHHLELYESPFNHLIGEASMLFVLGTVFPEFDESPRWRERGRQILESRLEEQFHADGGSVEQATVYHHATLGFYLLAALVARRNQQDLPLAVWNTLERALEYSMHLIQPDGRQPAIGDNDDARPFAFDLRDNWDFRYLLAVGAVLFRRPDFKAVAGRMPEDAFWLLGPPGLTAFCELNGVSRQHSSIALPASGYVVLRSEGDEAGDYLCFDCGEQAGGLRRDDVPSAAHGHADALSIVSFLSGQPILVDPGFYTYGGDRSWEAHFRETAAHNTVRVDGADQARHIDKMAWSHVPRVELESFQTGPAGSWAVASHDGYARSPNGVQHRRTVWLRPTGYLIVYDELTGRGDHTAEVIFQLHQALAVELHATALVLNGRFAIRWSATLPVRARVHRGEERADGGWIAPRLGARTPAARLVLTAPFSNVLRVLITISDGRIWKTDSAPFQAQRGALVQTLSSDAHIDLIAANLEAGGAVCMNGSVGQYETDAAVAVWRQARDHVVEATRIGGTFIRPCVHEGNPC